MNKLIRYFDLVSEYRPKGPQARTAGPGTQELHWLPQYIALLIGIFAQRYLQQYLSTGSYNLTGALGWLVASVLLAGMVFPAVYKNAFDATKPLFFQLCVIFSAGLGWESVVGTAALKGLGIKS